MPRTIWSNGAREEASITDIIELGKDPIFDNTLVALTYNLSELEL